MSLADDLDRDRARALEAQAKAAQALARLLQRAETRDSGQSRRIAGFLAATYDGEQYPYDLFELRTFDAALSDDMLMCLDALRWGQADLYKLLPDGEPRLRRVIQGVAAPRQSAEAAEAPVPTRAAPLNTRLVSLGDAPGYRDVSLTLDCTPAASGDVAPVQLELHVGARDAVRLMQHLQHVQAVAWDGRVPLDAEPGETKPPWLA